MGKHRDWTEIRQEYEQGASFSKLAEKHQIAMGTLKKAAAREGWQHKEKAVRAEREKKALQKLKREPTKSRPENGTTPVPFTEDEEKPEPVTREEVLQGLLEVARERDSERVSVKDRLRALELLGRHLGLFEQKKDTLDREEQQARIAKLRADTKQQEGEAERSVVVRFVGTGGAEK